ncbi:hypothetical protein VPNG_07427 [Cytospora leucostoma]|uniref:Cyanovirin-N domain-containing protein n=1 Tax=Cytospora leucostoma TaxID=1230097 RepID=A0A423WMZ2_9PEZI|nr:hypothetical protein VPNG_07427 [Cytospora leucostoma]
MRSLALLTILTSALIAVIATPLQRRQIGGVLICNGAHATGNCTYQVYRLDTCHNLTAAYYRDAATFAPDGEEFYCYPYIQPCGGVCTSPEGCTAGALSYNTTDRFNLTALGGWDRYIAAFECHAGTASKGLGFAGIGDFGNWN